MAVLPARLFDRPNAVLVYGASRPLVNLTLFAIATTTNPLFQWVDIRVPSERVSPFDPVQLGWIPEGRLWRVDQPDALRPDDRSANLSLVGTIRSDEPPETLAQVSEFLRLPDRSQQILAVPPPEGKPGVVVVTDTHRAEGTISANRVPSILKVHRNAGFSVFVGYGKSPGSGRDSFDFVFRVDDGNVADWGKTRLVCEWGITSGPLRDSRPVLFEEIPCLADVVSRVARAGTERNSSA